MPLIRCLAKRCKTFRRGNGKRHLPLICTACFTFVKQPNHTCLRAEVSSIPRRSTPTTPTQHYCLMQQRKLLSKISLQTSINYFWSKEKVFVSMQLRPVQFGHH